jgi:hypothetical protein
LRQGLANYLPRLALNHDPHDLCLLVDRIIGKPPVLGSFLFLSLAYCSGYEFKYQIEYAWNGADVLSTFLILEEEL